jgi:phosphatidylserine/phosphatidylglycerophosphate/cardiolipin synthase-like enzyme
MRPAPARPESASPAQTPAPTLSAPAILRAGETCGRIAHAPRAAALIDGADYFLRLEQALKAARRSVLILGWDFDHRIRLRPDDPKGLALSAFLRGLVEARPELEIRVLVWSVAVLHAPSEPTQLLLGAGWEKHPRISVKLDSFHPIYAAHHQKIVCVDDALAFVGGMDLTVRRWDRRPHAPDDPLRLSPEGAPYRAIHDAQMVVDGEAARAVAQIARARWRRATGERAELVTMQNPAHDLLPDDLEPDFTDVLVGVARTAPAGPGESEVREAEALTRACLRAAQRCVYIEAQYMTCAFVGALLAQALRRPDGPDVFVLMTRESRGLAERLVMGRNRDRLMRRLKRADPYDRLRVCYPVVSGEPVMVHSKLIIVDDVFVRIGSSNLNNRSMGLDTECDLAIEARDARTRAAIADLRRRLIAEHLGASPLEVEAQESASGGSMTRALEALNEAGKAGTGLRCFEAMTAPGPTRPVFGTRLLDPARPFEPFWLLRRRKRP